MSMTAGDFDFDSIFRQDPTGGSDNAEEIPFPPISYVLWIVFVIIMPILLTNMLVCIKCTMITLKIKGTAYCPCNVYTVTVATTSHNSYNCPDYGSYITAGKFSHGRVQAFVHVHDIKLLI